MLTFTTILLLLCTLYLASAIRIANENERFALITLGRFTGIKGPGLVLHSPHVQKLIRISLGKEGQVQSDTLAVFDGNAVPFVASGRVRTGMRVRVSAFEANAFRVEPLDQAITCEKCGHKMVLR